MDRGLDALEGPRRPAAVLARDLVVVDRCVLCVAAIPVHLLMEPDTQAGYRYAKEPVEATEFGSTIRFSAVGDSVRIAYARTPDGLNIAYTTLGEGERDLVMCWSGPTHIRRDQQEPLMARFHARLGSFARLVIFDERGCGMSSPLPSAELPDLEERMDDLRCVLDKLEIQRASLFGWMDGGMLAMMFSATYPERVDRLVLFHSFPRCAEAPDFPEGFSPEVLQRLLDVSQDRSAEARARRFDIWGPSTDDAFRQRWEELAEDNGGPDRMSLVFRRAWASDVRPALGAIVAPVLVLHRRDSKVVPLAMSRYLTDHIAEARLVELPGRDTWPFAGDMEGVAAEVEEFITGERSAPDVDRVLATVLFTDIVGSTDVVARVGDRRWRELIDDHDSMTARQVERFRGRLVNRSGDGLLASFDGPARSIRCACAIRDGARSMGLQIRAGIHAGECEVQPESLRGIAVHVGARVCALAGPEQVLVSSVIPPLVAGSGIRFTDHGEHQLKGVPDRMRLFAVDA